MPYVYSILSQTFINKSGFPVKKKTKYDIRGKYNI